MGVIHQIYATHCTYGSSAIERRNTGDLRDRVLGYSARASSFAQSDLRRHFPTLQRFLYYHLPNETPPGKKLALTPHIAPHRLFFCPSLSGLQVLGYISYRAQDRAGRVGSHFAHVLAAPIAASETPWDILECLQLWDAPGWVVEDLDTLSHDLPSLDKLSDLRGRTHPVDPAVDERVQPLDQLDSLLGAGVGARRYKLHGLLQYVKTHHRLPGTGPGGCRWLWTEKTPTGRGPHKLPLLFELLQSPSANAQLVRDSLDAVPDEGLPLLFRGLLKAPLDQSERNDLLERIAGRPGFDVISLINEIKSELGTHGALSSTLFEPLKAALDHVHEQPGRFGEIASALEAAKSLLDTPTASRANAWVELKRTFDKNQQEMASQKTGLKPRIVSGGKIWAFTEKVCECLDRCFPVDPYDAFRRDNFKKFGAFVRHAAATHQLGELLPEGDKFDNYLMAHFRRDEKSKKRIANRGPWVWTWMQDHPLQSLAMALITILMIMAITLMLR